MLHPIRTGACFLALGSLAHAQLLSPVGQDRHVGAEALAIDGGNVVSDTDTDAATDFGPFTSTAHAQVNPSGLAEGGAWLDSALVGDALVASGTSFATADSNCDTWSHLAEGASVAQIDFTITQDVSYHVSGQVEGYGLGYGAWELVTDTFQWIDGFSSTVEGVTPIEANGRLAPGTYRIGFRAASGASSSGCDLSTGSAAFELAFELVEAPTNYCTSAPNSVGAGAVLSAGGSQSIDSNSFQLEATGCVPNELALFYYGASQTQQPFGDGFRCVAGPLFRLHTPGRVDASGAFARTIDFTVVPAGSGAGLILPLSTWNFQLWYADPSGPGGSGFNFSDATSVRFLP